jgi:hypothetical protein
MVVIGWSKMAISHKLPRSIYPRAWIPPNSGLSFCSVPEDLTDVGFAFPSRPMLLMKLHEGHGAFDGFFFGWELEDREAAKTIVGNSPNKWLDAQVAIGLNWESGWSMPWKRTTTLSPARVVVTRDFGLRKDVC